MTWPLNTPDTASLHLTLPTPPAHLQLPRAQHKGLAWQKPEQNLGQPRAGNESPERDTAES